MNLDNIEEEAERSHSKAPRHSEPIDIHRNKEDESTSPSHKPRKPIGGIGGPMLLAGLGGPHMLKVSHYIYKNILKQVQCILVLSKKVKQFK